jgi:hypothetical protein
MVEICQRRLLKFLSYYSVFNSTNEKILIKIQLQLSINWLEVSNKMALTDFDLLQELSEEVFTKKYIMLCGLLGKAYRSKLPQT